MEKFAGNVSEPSLISLWLKSASCRDGMGVKSSLDRLLSLLCLLQQNTNKIQHRCQWWSTEMHWKWRRASQVPSRRANDGDCHQTHFLKEFREIMLWSIRTLVFKCIIIIKTGATWNSLFSYGMEIVGRWLQMDLEQRGISDDNNNNRKKDAVIRTKLYVSTQAKLSGDKVNVWGY